MVDRQVTSVGVNGVWAGEQWRLRTPEGTEFWFGQTGDSVQDVPVFSDDAGEPCHVAGGLYLSYCQMGYRWNLDKVVDRRGNQIVYRWFDWHANYGRYLNSVAAGYSVYGLPLSAEYGMSAASGWVPQARVVFEAGYRCIDAGQYPASCEGTANQWKWPDTPWDRYCPLVDSSCPGRTSPTFWTVNRLHAITTQVRTGAGGWDGVGRWEMSYSWPATNDGTAPTLWLNAITPSGLVGGVAAGPVTSFGGVRAPNRLAPPGVPTLNKWRVNYLGNNVGGYTQVSYANAECGSAPSGSEHDNRWRCFPQYYTDPNTGGGVWGWFHKYVVTSVSEYDLTGGGPPETWNYTYSTAGSSSAVLWHYDTNDLVPAAKRSWSQWRGYTTVTVSHGNQSVLAVTDTLYFRGMHGDRAGPAGGARSVLISDSQTSGQMPDYDFQRGVAREQTRHDAGTQLASSTIHETTNWAVASRAANTSKAYLSGETRTRTRTWVAATGSWRWAETSRTFDVYGQPVDTLEAGDPTTTTDDSCTHIDYARESDLASWMLTYPAQILTTDCTGTRLAGNQVLYDNTTTVGAAPTGGLVTKTLAQAATISAPETPQWRQSSRTTYDVHGRVRVAYDALDRPTSISYTPDAGGLATAMTVTNAAGHVTTSALNPAWGVPVTQTDPNGKVTTAAYDPLGRLLKVWLPGRATNLTPNIEYSYLLRGTGANAVTTNKLGPNGNQIVSHQLYDGRLRPRQSQTVAPDGKRVITDTSYDDRGLVVARTAFYNNASGPTDTLVGYAPAAVDSITQTVYDNLQRPTATILSSLGTEKWRSTTAYDGDRTSVTPPAGGAATTTVFDVHGRTMQLRQYQAATPTGPYDATSYGYDRLGRLTTVTNPAGNVWTYRYDLRGRQTQTVDPDTGTGNYSYDDAGQMVTSTDGRGQTIANVYDSLGRIIERHDSTPTGPLRATWTYDTVAKGQLTSSTRYAGVNAYTTAITEYDNGYRPLGSTVTIPTAETGLAGTYPFAATYHIDGSLATATDPAAGGLPAETITTSYTDAGLPLTQTGAASYLSAVAYRWDGTPLQQTLGTGANRVRLTATLDEPTGRLTQAQTHTEHVGAPDTWDEKLTETYAYDPAGNVTGIGETAAGSTVSQQCFNYDYLRRLTEAWTKPTASCAGSPVAAGPDPYWLTWTFDTTGNRLTEVAHPAGGNLTTTYTVPTSPTAARPHAVTATSTTSPGGTTTNSYGYDQAGNMITRNVAGKPNQNLTWDPEGHLATVTDSTGTSSYLYDPNGQRLIARDPAATTLTLGAMELRRDTSTGSVTATRFYGTAVRTTTGGLTWQVGDHHGTGHLAINAATLTPTRRKTLPYGETRGTHRPPGPTATATSAALKTQPGSPTWAPANTTPPSAASSPPTPSPTPVTPNNSTATHTLATTPPPAAIHPDS